jgi:hypothetical protein
LNEDIGSGSEVNRLVSELVFQRMPSVNFAHGDLTSGEQRPEQHGCGLGRGQQCLGLDPTFELLARVANNSPTEDKARMYPVILVLLPG